MVIFHGYVKLPDGKWSNMFVVERNCTLTLTHKNVVVLYTRYINYIMGFKSTNHEEREREGEREREREEKK